MRPNFIVIFADNLGYGDFGCYGSTKHRTPNIDRMAAEGLRLTHYYSCSGVCTPSRASLLTGCYPRRVGLHVSGEDRAVLMPVDPKGLHPDEVTVATLLRRCGYATACIGKWHLGDQPPFLPTRHGFDRYFGVPYSDDMTPRPERPHWPPLPLMRDEKVIEAPVDRDYLTQRYTAEAVSFIREQRERPFFLFLPHAMPGSTNRPFASPDFQGRSANGPYGDCVEEMDWSTGEILRTLAELGLDEQTLVLWTCDHGAVQFEPPQGSNAPLKGWAYDTSEGAMRAPLVARWPGHIPPGQVSGTLVSQLDWLPTLAALAGTSPTANRRIDGHDIRPLLRGERFASPYDESGFFYYFREQLQAVRSGPWKLYLPLASTVTLRGVQGPTPQALYHLVDDPAEGLDL
ncbi:MAG: sulfatase, partial [Armatimonadetes bacterium]|nr:sulfatase [Armatimonadota bacterium]